MRNVLVAVVVVLAAAVHACVWLYMGVRVSPPDATSTLESVSFSPVRPDLDGQVDETTEAQINSDLKVIAPYTEKIRTYGSTGGLELVPKLAADYGLRVILGAWIDKRTKHNEQEVESAIALAKEYRNIDSVIVGNESIYWRRAEEAAAVKDLIDKIQRVKRAVSVPVSTAEFPDTWLNHPELASAVDYIAVHILPYWEGLPGDVAVDHTMEVYRKLREAYPGKHIVIAEFGWPSAGLNRKDAVPGKLAQAQIIRDFIARADAMGIDYSIIEAFDQPWKTSEGSVGPYWGLFNADRQPKFALTGPVETPNLVRNLMTAITIGFLLSLAVFAIPRVTLIQATLLAVTAQAIGAWSADLID
jgi:exo-beta-1,3-glucanase (GH17 family)